MLDHAKASDSFFRRFYPDPTTYDGTLAFYGWLRQYVAPYMTVLNVGAGPATKKPIQVLKGSVAKVVGIDIEPTVLQNEEVDEAHVTDGVHLPFPDESFDLAYADYVLEHVENPVMFLTEIRRVLKVGGSFFFRTPNRWHYVAMISGMTPHWFHKLIANRVRVLDKGAHEPWRTRYLLNTQTALMRASERAGFDSCEVRFFEAEPFYLLFNRFAFLIGVAYERTVNSTELLSCFRANLFGRMGK